MHQFDNETKWIWFDNSGKFNTYAEFTAAFPATKNDHAVLSVSAEGHYAAYVNGVYIESAQYADFPAFKAVQHPDISEFLKNGENSLLLQVWYPGEDTSTTRKELPGVRFEIQVSGEKVCRSTTETLCRPICNYKTGADIPLITGQQGRSFAFVSAAPFSWSRAVEIDKPAVCVPRPISELTVKPPIPARLSAQGEFAYDGGNNIGERMQRAGLYFREVCEMTSLSESNGSLPERMDFPVTEGLDFAAKGHDGIYLTFDLGAEYYGYLMLDITCPEEAHVAIGFGEHLADGRIRTSVGGRCFAAEYSAGPERKPFIHRFSRLGTRYITLMISAASCRIYHVSLMPVEYPVKELPCIQTGDALHDKIAEISKRTLLTCMHEHYEDCPWREQALYAFDSRNQMLCGYYAFHETVYARENLRLLALSQREDGLLELCAPARIPITIPSFSLAFIISLEEYLVYSGDSEFVIAMLPVCERIFAAFLPQIRNGLTYRFDDPKYWNFYEWQPMLNGYNAPDTVKESAECCLQLFLILAMQRMQSIRQKLGMSEDIALSEAEKILTKELEAYWDEEDCGYASFLFDGKKTQYAELTQSLALYANVVPKKRIAAMSEKLLNHEYEVPVTLSYSLFKYEALLRDHENRSRVYGEIAERWGNMLFGGATTFWEVDEGECAFARAGSLCHGWSAIPYYLYCKYPMK